MWLDLQLLQPKKLNCSFEQLFSQTRSCVSKNSLPIGICLESSNEPHRLRSQSNKISSPPLISEHSMIFPIPTDISNNISIAALGRSIRVSSQMQFFTVQLQIYRTSNSLIFLYPECVEYSTRLPQIFPSTPNFQLLMSHVNKLT